MFQYARPDPRNSIGYGAMWHIFIDAFVPEQGFAEIRAIV
jgi:hypothetical protein